MLMCGGRVGNSSSLVSTKILSGSRVGSRTRTIDATRMINHQPVEVVKNSPVYHRRVQVLSHKSCVVVLPTYLIDCVLFALLPSPSPSSFPSPSLLLLSMQHLPPALRFLVRATAVSANLNIAYSTPHSCSHLESVGFNQTQLKMWKTQTSRHQQQRQPAMSDAVVYAHLILTTDQHAAFLMLVGVGTYMPLHTISTASVSSSCIPLFRWHNTGCAKEGDFCF